LPAYYLSSVVCKHLTDNNLFFHEQKGCRQGSRGTLDNLCMIICVVYSFEVLHSNNNNNNNNVDKAILCEVHQCRKILETVWIDYQKAYDSVPHSWIMYYLKMFGVAPNI